MRKITRLALTLCVVHLGMPGVSAGTGTLTLEDGRTFTGNISAAGEGQVRLAREAEQGEIANQIPFQTIARIDMDLVAEEISALLAPSSQNMPVLEKLWKRVEPFAGKSGGTAPVAGSALVHALLVSGSDPARPDKILSQLKSTPGEDAIGSLRILEAQVLLAMHRKAEDRVRELLDSAPTDPALTQARLGMDARTGMFGADAAIAELDALEEEWPRWHLMPDIIKTRKELIDRILLGYLRIPVFLPDEHDLAASALLQSARIFRRTARIPDAVARLNDIFTDHPGSTSEAAARALLEELRSDPDFPADSPNTSL